MALAQGYAIACHQLAIVGYWKIQLIPGWEKGCVFLVLLPVEPCFVDRFI